MKFVIATPYRQTQGGIIVLHALCYYLAKAGYNSKIFCCDGTYYEKKHKIKFWIHWIIDSITKDFTRIMLVKILGEKFTGKFKIFKGYAYISVRGCKRKFLPFVDDNTIVVYPESVHGNYLRAKNVVRWFLFHNQFDENDSEAFGKNDLFFCFRDVFNDPKLNPKGRKLYINYFDENLYKRTNFGKRSGTCYVIRKGKNRSDLPENLIVGGGGGRDCYR